MATKPGSIIFIAMPVLTKTRAPGANSIELSKQARKSNAAEPSVAYDGNGMEFPRSGLTIFVSIFRSITHSKSFTYLNNRSRTINTLIL